jgi:ABC-type uncharacterized transport system substrate-binding protein
MVYRVYSVKHLVLFALALGLLVTTAGARAQDSSRAPAIGFLMISAGPADPIFEAMRAGLHDHGYIEGRDYRIEYRSAHGDVNRLPQLVEELVRLKVAAIVTGTWRRR